MFPRLPNPTPKCIFPVDWRGFCCSGSVVAVPVADLQSRVDSNAGRAAVFAPWTNHAGRFRSPFAPRQAHSSRAAHLHAPCASPRSGLLPGLQHFGRRTVRQHLAQLVVQLPLHLRNRFRRHVLELLPLRPLLPHHGLDLHSLLRAQLPVRPRHARPSSATAPQAPAARTARGVLDRPDGLHIGNVQGCWDGRRPQGGGHPSSRSISAGTPRAAPARVHPDLQESLHAPGPSGRLIRTCGSIPQCARCQSIMTFLAPSTDPADFQSILEVSPISLDRCVTHQPGSYIRSRPPASLPPTVFIPL